jgi:hypothetical protein
MAARRPTPSSGYRVTLFDGLSDLEQAAIAREYEARTSRPFRCQPCLEAGRLRPSRVGPEAEEPASEVVAVMEEVGQPIPVCEACYRRINDSNEVI